jgi:hypothetical protein
MHIDNYSFGKIVINNKTYTSDVIVYPDRVDAAWWRREGHTLQEIDLSDIVAANPDILIIGTGHSGVMQVPERTKSFLASKGINFYIVKTGEAVKLFNNQFKGEKVIGALHLTC